MLPCFDFGLGARTRLLLHHDDLASSLASGDSLSQDSSLVVELSLSDHHSPLLVVSLGKSTAARLVSDHDHSSSLVTSDHTPSPNGVLLGDSLLSLNSDLGDASVSDSHLGSPPADVRLRAWTWLVVDHDDSTSLGTSGKPACVDVFLDDQLLPVDLSLDDSDLSEVAFCFKSSNLSLAFADLDIDALASLGVDLGGFDPVGDLAGLNTMSSEVLGTARRNSHLRVHSVWSDMSSAVAGS